MYRYITIKLQKKKHGYRPQQRIDHDNSRSKGARKIVAAVQVNQENKCINSACINSICYCTIVQRDTQAWEMTAENRDQKYACSWNVKSMQLKNDVIPSKTRFSSRQERYITLSFSTVKKKRGRIVSTKLSPPRISRVSAAPSTGIAHRADGWMITFQTKPTKAAACNPVFVLSYCF